MLVLTVSPSQLSAEGGFKRNKAAGFVQGQQNGAEENRWLCEAVGARLASQSRTVRRREVQVFWCWMCGSGSLQPLVRQRDSFHPCFHSPVDSDVSNKPVKRYVSEQQKYSVCDYEEASLWSVGSTLGHQPKPELPSSARRRCASLALFQGCSFLWRTLHVFWVFLLGEF